MYDEECALLLLHEISLKLNFVWSWQESGKLIVTGIGEIATYLILIIRVVLFPMKWKSVYATSWKLKTLGLAFTLCLFCWAVLNGRLDLLPKVCLSELCCLDVAHVLRLGPFNTVVLCLSPGLDTFSLSWKMTTCF